MPSVYAHTCSDGCIYAHSDMDTHGDVHTLHTVLSLCKQGHRSAHSYRNTQVQADLTQSPQEPPLPSCCLRQFLTAPSWSPSGQGNLAPLPVSSALGWLSASSLPDHEARGCFRCSPKPALAPGEEVSSGGPEAGRQKISLSHPKESLHGRIVSTMVAGVLQRHLPTTAGSRPHPYLGNCAHTC